ncbi:MAG: glycosyltransferase family 1 protein [Spirochaetes bacterium]|nr:MAG: glycosyltransferase family 1 protein [Spirochaetota bacterium]
MKNGRNIGFVSFRFAGTDGVSLETFKWAEVLKRRGFKCFYMAGELETPEDNSFLVPETHFMHPKIREMHHMSFDNTFRPKTLTDMIHDYRIMLKKKIYEFIKKFNIDLLIPENAITIPLNIPLGLAITEVIAETGISTIAHHHDFFWERKRFLTNCVWDYLNSAFPPRLSTMAHVVINSSGRNQLALRTGASATLIPNVMEFEQAPHGVDDYSSDVRKELGIPEDAIFVLQPTRVVQRKGIEHAIELVRRLGEKAVLVISHASGDEGYQYQNRVKSYAELLNVNTIFAQDRIDYKRGINKEGKKVYTLNDIYDNADFITYPSIFEGFGNAFLEAIYHKKPILVNNYSIYAFDIKPKGFKVVEMNDFISDETVEHTKKVLEDEQYRKDMVETNYMLGLKHFSYHVLDTNIRTIITSLWGKTAFYE